MLPSVLAIGALSWYLFTCRKTPQEFSKLLMVPHLSSCPHPRTLIASMPSFLFIAFPFCLLFPIWDSFITSQILCAARKPQDLRLHKTSSCLSSSTCSLHNTLSTFFLLVQGQFSISHAHLLLQFFKHFPCCFFCLFCLHMKLRVSCAKRTHNMRSSKTWNAQYIHLFHGTITCTCSNPLCKPMNSVTAPGCFGPASASYGSTSNLASHTVYTAPPASLLVHPTQLDFVISNLP